MARRRRMFKQLSNNKTENIGHTGGIYNLYKIDKQQASFTSAWLEKLRIAYHLDVSDESATRPNDIGVTFYLSTSSSSVDSAYLVSATGSNGYGGTVTLDAKRSIRDEGEDSSRGDGALYVHIQPSDLNLPAGDITVNCVAEAYGRWHQITGL